MDTKTSSINSQSVEPSETSGALNKNHGKIKETAAESNDGPKIKIMSWNINGLRTLDIPSILQQLDCSVLAVQETKLTRKQLDQSQIIPHGYSSYFSFSSKKTGYSGVAIFCSDNWIPAKAEEGLCIQDEKRDDGVGCYPDISDDEEAFVKHANLDGRTVLTQHFVMMPDGTQKLLTIINVYCPRLRDDPDDPSNNTDFKRTFHEVLHRRAQKLAQQGSFVVLLGDMNISHKWIDQCDTEEKTFVVNEFRELLNQFLDSDSNSFVDTFRLLHPTREAAYTCWCTRLNARENNYGTRIDYIFVDKELVKYVEKAEIHTDVMGSDHCPISVTFHTLRPISHRSPPSFATKYYPEFKGKQKNIKDLFMNPQQPSSGEIKLTQSSNSIIEKEGKKRSFELDSKSKSQPAKRVQTNLHSFFTKSQQEKVTPVASTIKVLECEDSSDNISRPQCDFDQKRQKSSDVWKQLMKAPDVPLCKGHGEPCVRRTVKKKGVNYGREFWSCSHGVGKSDDPNANCNHFQWMKS